MSIFRCKGVELLYKNSDLNRIRFDYHPYFIKEKKNLNFSAIIANESHMVLILIDLNRFMALPLQERERKIVFRKFNLMLLWMRKWCRRSIGVEFFMLPFFCITLHIAEALKFMHEVYLLPFTWCPKSLLEICWFFFLLFFFVCCYVCYFLA